MKLLTVATESKGYFPVLEQSASRFGAELVVLGWEQRWRGFVWRLMLVKEFLDGLPDDEVVCFIDAYDVVLLRDPAELETAFLALSAATGCRLIFGCDRPKPLVLKAASRYMFGQCQSKSINAGSYIGFAGAVREMIEEILSRTSDPSDDDQVQVVRYCNGNQDKIHIDCDNLLFLTFVNPLKPFEAGSNVRVDSDGRLFHNGIRPFLAHGAGQTNMDDICEALGYDLPDEQKAIVRRYHVNATVKKAFMYAPFFKGAFSFAAVLAVIAWLVLRRAPKRR